MNTRRAKDDAPLSQGRYMSSPEFLQLRGISATATAAKSAITLPGVKRDLIWFVQGMSIRESGLRKLATDLVAMFPDRLGTKSMHQIGIDPSKMVPWDQAHQVHWELDIVDIGDLLPEEIRSESRNGARTKPVPMRNLINLCIKAAMSGLAVERNCNQLGGVPSIEEFLIDLCINPRVQISLENASEPDAVELDLVKERFHQLDDRDFTVASLPYFKNIIGTLLDYMHLQASRAAENFQQTAISRKIWKTLDYGLLTKNMVLIDGLEGRGKSEASKAWCAAHPSHARFVSLKGIDNKTTAFREIAKALGIARGYGSKSNELQNQIEDVLQRSKLMLVMDEAHFLFNQRQKIYTRPELIDWIDTAICNQGIPIALVTTPQFMVCMTRAAEQVDWNYRQFRRRVKRYIKLPERNSEQDIRAVLKRVLPGAPEKAIDYALGYVLLSKRDLSAVGDLVDELRFAQGTEKLSTVSLDALRKAVEEQLIPSDKAFAEAVKGTEEAMQRRSRRAKSQRPAELLQATDEEESDQSQPEVTHRGQSGFSEPPIGRVTRPVETHVGA